MTLLVELRAAGLQLEPRPGKVHVSPLEALTPTRRQAILTHKTELLAALELESRVRAMATRWQYSPEDMAEALEAACVDSAGWLAAVEWDEQLHSNVRRAGVRRPV